MGEQLTLLHRDPDGYGDLYDNSLCEHCGAEHDLPGPYCSEACSHRARHDPDECHLVEYEPACCRPFDRSDCAHYWECSRVAANKDAPAVCEAGCARYVRDTEQPFTILRSNAGMVMT